MVAKANPRELKPWQRKLIQKSQKQGFKVPVDVWQKINKELLAKHDIKTFQALYDYLIVSGLVYLKKDIVELVRSRIPDYTARYKRWNLAKLGKGEAEVMPEMHSAQAMMYSQDLEAFNKYIIEEKDLKKFWAIQILLEEFAQENPIILNHIQECKKHKVTERKQQVSRLLDDEYIVMLSDQDQEAVLERLTERYDNRQFESKLIQAEIQKIVESSQNKYKQEVEEEDEFNKKLAAIRAARRSRADAITNPIIDDDT